MFRMIGRFVERVLNVARHRIFYSFEYNKDYWRAVQIRNMGKVSADFVFSDSDWKEVRVKTNAAIKEWIDEQIAMCDCVVVLIGSTTATRKWVLYEIEKAYELKKGLVGIYVNKITDRVGYQTGKGKNPFEYVLTRTGEKLSDYVVCYDSPRLGSQSVCKDIAEKLEELVESAVGDRG